VASIINDRIERGLPAERTLRFRAREFLRLSGRGTEGAAYRSLEDALDRLRSTMVKTSLFEGTRRDRQAFGWIDSYRIAARELRGGREVMGHVEVTLNEWTFQAILAGRRLLTISPAYFRLTSSLERRLYELTRKHCGQQREWRIGLPRLAERSARTASCASLSESCCGSSNGTPCRSTGSRSRSRRAAAPGSRT
jgi:plasmid replication initiation protein